METVPCAAAVAAPLPASPPEAFFDAHSAPMPSASDAITPERFSTPSDVSLLDVEAFRDAVHKSDELLDVSTSQGTTTASETSLSEVASSQGWSPRLGKQGENSPEVEVAEPRQGCGPTIIASAKSQGSIVADAVAGAAPNTQSTGRGPRKNRRRVAVTALEASTAGTTGTDGRPQGHTSSSQSDLVLSDLGFDLGLAATPANGTLPPHAAESQHATCIAASGDASTRTPVRGCASHRSPIWARSRPAPIDICSVQGAPSQAPMFESCWVGSTSPCQGQATPSGFISTNPMAPGPCFGSVATTGDASTRTPYGVTGCTSGSSSPCHGWATRLGTVGAESQSLAFNNGTTNTGEPSSMVPSGCSESEGGHSVTLQPHANPMSGSVAVAGDASARTPLRSNTPMGNSAALLQSTVHTGNARTPLGSSTPMGIAPTLLQSSAQTTHIVHPALIPKECWATPATPTPTTAQQLMAGRLQANDIVSTCPGVITSDCSPAGSPAADALRSWLQASGLPPCADLVEQLRAAAPESYED